MPVSDQQVRDLLGVLASFGRTMRSVARTPAGSLSNTRIGILKHVGKHGPQRLGDLAAELAVAPSVISRAVQTLEADDLVHRGCDPDDARASRIGITEIGEELIKEREDWYAERTRELFDDWNDGDIEAAVTVLERLNVAIKDFHTRAPVPGQRKLTALDTPAS